MNFKKIALALAIASSFGAQAAEPATSEYLTQFQAAGFAASDDGQAAVYADFLASASEGNVAYVFQESKGLVDAGSVAFVTQANGMNYATVVQSGMGALAFVNQVGGGAMNRAMIFQKETGDTVRITDLSADDSVDALAATELGGRVLSKNGNVALISQTGDAFENNAFIYQNGSSNFAAISQTGATTNFAYITQNGVGGSVAYISQK